MSGGSTEAVALKNYGRPRSETRVPILDIVRAACSAAHGMDKAAPESGSGIMTNCRRRTHGLVLHRLLGPGACLTKIDLCFYFGRPYSYLAHSRLGATVS